MCMYVCNVCMYVCMYVAVYMGGCKRTYGRVHPCVCVCAHGQIGVVRSN